MSDPLPEAPRRGLLVWTMQTVAVLGVLTLLVTQVFVRLVGEPPRATRIVAENREPETTGSITSIARETRLDPCTGRSTMSARR